MTGPFRLPNGANPRFGVRIDRSEPVGFRLGSAVHNGFYGDTLASALLAAGISTFGTSPGLGRPRGPMALDFDDASALLAQEGARRPIRAGDVLLKEGLKARLANGGVGQAALRHVTPRSLPEDRTLPGSQRALERLRRVLPLPAPRLPSPGPEPSGRLETCGALVIGAGLAGVAAASALKAAGLDVRLVEASARPGGVADLYEGRIDGEPLADWAERRAAEFADAGALALGATAMSIEPDGTVTVIERGAGRDGTEPVIRLISAGAVILATGFRERPMAFSGNDRPGVMFAGATRALLRRHAVAPGARVLVATSGDEGYRTAMDLREAGVAVDVVIDERDDPQGPAAEMAKALGARVRLSSVVAGVEFDRKRGALSGVRVRNRYGEGASADARILECDALVVSGGFAPRDELARRSGVSAGQGVFVASRGPNAVDAVEGGWAAGVAAAAAFGAKVGVSPPDVSASADEFGAPSGFAPASFAPGADACFVDIGADITFADLARMVARRGAAPSAIERRLGLGGGADGGRLSADLPAIALEALGADAAAFGLPSSGRPTLALLAARARLKRR